MKSRWTLALLCLPLSVTAACSYHARSAEKYRNDTQALLDTRQAAIKQCYDTALASQGDLQGTVAIQFTVEEDTGRVMNVAVSPAGTNAPEPLSQCVLNSVQGLALTPPDAREGLATFVYEFRVNPPA